MKNDDNGLYHFPATRFVCNGFWKQWWHMFSELIEIAVAWLKGDKQHAVTEVWNLRHSGETMHRIQSGMGLDVEMGKEQTLADNLERGYYQ